MHSLPTGWRWLSPSELAAAEGHALGIGPFGSDLKVSDYTKSGVPLVFVRNIRTEDFDLRAQPHVAVDKAAQLLAHRVLPGDVLITKMGEPPGDSAVYPDGAQEGRMTADCIRLRVSPEVCTPRYIMYATRAPAVRAQIIEATRGVAQKKISLERYRGVRYPVPSLDLQRRIVAAIETHFSRLDAAVASLTRAKANVKRARASVLKAAVEGRLVPTESALARAEGRPYEPASVLLDRILAERKAAWAASGARGRYQEPVKPETEGLPALPAGWCWATVQQLSEVTREPTYGVVKLGEPTEGGVPILRSSNVRQLRFELDYVKPIAPEIELQYRRTRLVGGELLVTVRGTLGGVVVAPKSCAGWNVSREVAVIALQRPELGRYVASAFASPVVDAWMSGRLRGVAYTGLNIETLKEVPIPMPPVREQHHIVAEVDRRLSVLDALDTTLDANLARCARLRQSILKRAFEGHLVPAEPANAR